MSGNFGFNPMNPMVPKLDIKGLESQRDGLSADLLKEQNNEKAFNVDFTNATDTIKKETPKETNFEEQETKLNTELQSLQSGESHSCFKTLVSARDCEIQKLESKKSSELQNAKSNNTPQSELDSIEKRYNEQIETKKKEYEQKIEDRRKQELDALNSQLKEVQQKKTEAENNVKQAESDKKEAETNVKDSQQKQAEIQGKIDQLNKDIDAARDSANAEQTKFEGERTVEQQNKTIEAFNNAGQTILDKFANVDNMSSGEMQALLDQINKQSGNYDKTLSEQLDVCGDASKNKTADAGLRDEANRIAGELKDAASSLPSKIEAKKADEAKQAEEAKQAKETQKAEDTPKTDKADDNTFVDKDGTVWEKVADEDLPENLPYAGENKDLKTLKGDVKDATKDLKAAIKDPSQRDAALSKAKDTITDLELSRDLATDPKDKKKIQGQIDKLNKEMAKFETKSTEHDTKVAMDNLKVADSCLKSNLKGADDVANIRTEDAQKQIDTLDKKIEEAKAKGDEKTVKALTKQKTKLQLAQTQTYMNLAAQDSTSGYMNDIKNTASEIANDENADPKLRKGMAKIAKQADKQAAKIDAKNTRETLQKTLNGEIQGDPEEILKDAKNQLSSNGKTMGLFTKMGLQSDIKKLEKSIQSDYHAQTTELTKKGGSVDQELAKLTDGKTDYRNLESAQALKDNIDTMLESENISKKDRKILEEQSQKLGAQIEQTKTDYAVKGNVQDWYLNNGNQVGPEEAPANQGEGNIMSWYQDSQPVEGPRTKDGAPVKATVPEKTEEPAQLSDDKVKVNNQTPELKPDFEAPEQGPTMKIDKKGETVEINGQKVEKQKTEKSSDTKETPKDVKEEELSKETRERVDKFMIDEMNRFVGDANLMLGYERYTSHPEKFDSVKANIERQLNSESISQLPDDHPDKKAALETLGKINELQEAAEAKKAKEIKDTPAEVNTPKADTPAETKETPKTEAKETPANVSDETIAQPKKCVIHSYGSSFKVGSGVNYADSNSDDLNNAAYQLFLSNGNVVSTQETNQLKILLTGEERKTELGRVINEMESRGIDSVPTSLPGVDISLARIKGSITPPNDSATYESVKNNVNESLNSLEDTIKNTPKANKKTKATWNQQLDQLEKNVKNAKEVNSESCQQNDKTDMLAYNYDILLDKIQMTRKSI